ncbi:iron chaperone [Metabacillus malikii]|uniref:Uncharacterized protein YdhG (YjbR/CyaY superfamily) n=1 Tax=Metabacillus malikii TaxID=1504265 RepID=A0ABT9Z9T3_9BACI|nr:iron chaperone [Metabacillus malikii]MDQ0229018.1 uncharacterized protein YdhG (YjbR/CyaY superfamily) [Metabacillus malikii]
MEIFAEFLSKIDNGEHRTRIEEVLTWIGDKYSNLEPVVKWNQPMFTDHGTYIIGFSVAKKHFAVAPEQVAMTRFTKEIEEAGYEYTKELIRFKWDKPTNYELLEKLIDFNISDKADCTTFWRK